MTEIGVTGIGHSQPQVGRVSAAGMRAFDRATAAKVCTSASHSEIGRDHAFIQRNHRAHGLDG